MDSATLVVFRAKKGDLGNAPSFYRLPRLSVRICFSACPKLNPSDRADGDDDGSHRDPPPPTATALPPTSTPTVVPPTPTPTPIPVISALNALAVKTNRQRGETILLSDGKIYTSVTEYIAPDRFHFVSALDEIVVIGQRVFVRQNDVFVETSIPATNIVDFRGLERAGEGIDGIKRSGAESLNGQQVVVYEYERKMNTGDTEASIKRTMWIDVAEKFLRKMTIDGVSLGLDTKTEKRPIRRPSQPSCLSTIRQSRSTCPLSDPAPMRISEKGIQRAGTRYVRRTTGRNSVAQRFPILRLVMLLPRFPSAKTIPGSATR